MTAEPHAPHSMIAPALQEAAIFAERTLEALLPAAAGPQAPLIHAMTGQLMSQERGLRSFFVLQSGRLFGVDRQPLGRVAAAVECVQAAGVLAFTASTPLLTLTGEALMAEAFALLGSADALTDPYARAELMSMLAQCAGHGGLLGGLAADAAGVGLEEDRSLPTASRLQRMKMAALTGFCCEAGALLGRASPPARHALSAYGQDAGLALAIAADLASPDGLERGGIAAALGRERAQAQAEALAAQAVRHLDLFDEKADLLRGAAGLARVTEG